MIEFVNGFIVYVIVLGAPVCCLILSLKNIAKIIKSKMKKTAVEKSTIVKACIFGGIFVCIILFYAWFIYILSQSIANM